MEFLDALLAHIEFVAAILQIPLDHEVPDGALVHHGVFLSGHVEQVGMQGPEEICWSIAGS